MLGLPRVTLKCQRCGKPREGIRHVCRSNSSRPATVRPKLDHGKCQRCGKPTSFLGIGHTCRSKSGDFARRKKAAVKKQRTTNRHEYSACPDPANCSRSACVAYREGISTGALEGYDQGYDTGYRVGLSSCPLPHQ